MKVLYVCHRLPFPPKRGGKIRPFNMIRHLHRSGHSVTVASLARSPHEAEEGRGLSDHCSRVLVETLPKHLPTLRMVARLPSSVPSSMGYFFSPRLKQRIASLAARERFDLVFVHCSSVAQYVEHLDGPVKILDFGDMDSQKWLTYAGHKRWPLSMGYWLEGTKLEREEKRLARQFDMLTCTTRAEFETLQSYGTGQPADWFPNGVDAEFFAPAETAPDPDTITFVGRMDYFPNQQAVTDFCRDVMPLLRQRHGAIRLQVVGAEPPASIRRLAEQPGVVVTGTVPDVRPYVQGSILTVAPLAIARGTQNKILESMAMGVPVVSSPAAAGGVDAVAGEHILTAQTPDEYCEAVLRLIADPQCRARFSAASRERVLSNHSWPGSMQRLDAIIERTGRSGTTTTAGPVQKASAS